MAIPFGQVDEAGSSFYDPSDALSQSNVQAIYQHGYGPTRVESVQIGQFRPCEMSHDQTNKHRNAEAGTSRLVPSLPPYVGSTTSQPPGWIPERSADAESTQSTTEEDEALVSGFYRSKLPRVIEWSFGVRCPRSGTSRKRSSEFDSEITIDSAAGSKGGRGCPVYHTSPMRWTVSKYTINQNGAPDQVDCNTVAVKVVPTIRPVVNEDPCLAIKAHTRAPGREVSVNAKRKRRRALRQTESLLELSRYYQPKQGEQMWDRLPLVKEGKR